jgi:hypothetical protein
VIRRAGIVVGGFALLLAGGALLVLPGPGLPLVVGGLALLSLEFHWARRLREWLLRRAGRLTPASRRRRVGLAVATTAGAAGTSAAAAIYGIPGI